MPLMTIVMGNLTNVFGAFSVPGVPNVNAINSVEEFNRDVSSLTKDFVYVGAGLFLASYISTVIWIVCGERIARRIQR